MSFKTLLFALLMILPTTSKDVAGEVQNRPKTEAKLFNEDYKKYDSLVKDIPAAGNLVETSKKMDDLYKSLVIIAGDEKADSTQTGN